MFSVNQQHLKISAASSTQPFLLFAQKLQKQDKKHFSINAYLYSCLIEFATLPPLSFYVRSATTIVLHFM